MKYTLKRNSTKKVEGYLNWEIEKLTLEGEELIESLREYLSNVMEGILDPDISDKKPDGFLKNLQSGRFGDFSKRYIITAKDDSKVVGLLIGIPKEGKKLHIYSMGVLKEYRNRGVASGLLAKCINDILDDNVKEIALDVHSDNIPAYSLYKKFEFQ